MWLSSLLLFYVYHSLFPHLPSLRSYVWTEDGLVFIHKAQLHEITVCRKTSLWLGSIFPQEHPPPQRGGENLASPRETLALTLLYELLFWSVDRAAESKQLFRSKISSQTKNCGCDLCESDMKVGVLDCWRKLTKEGRLEIDGTEKTETKGLCPNLIRLWLWKMCGNEFLLLLFWRKLA